METVNFINASLPGGRVFFITDLRIYNPLSLSKIHQVGLRANMQIFSLFMVEPGSLVNKKSLSSLSLEQQQQ